VTPIAALTTPKCRFGQVLDWAQMSWKFLSTRELVAQRESYQGDLARRAEHVTNDFDAQLLLNENQDWLEFLRALLEFEERGSDPTSLRPVKESRKIIPGFYAFREHGFTAIFHADAETETAIEVLFYRNSTPKKWLRYVARFLAPYWRTHVHLLPYVAINLFALALGVGGVIIAAHNHFPSEGGRGGIFATVVAFLSLFCDPDEPIEVYEVTGSKGAFDAQRFEQFDSKMVEVVRALRANSRKQTVRNWATVIGGSVGTIFWGFGDVFAGWLTK